MLPSISGTMSEQPLHPMPALPAPTLPVVIRELEVVQGQGFTVRPEQAGLELDRHGEAVAGRIDRQFPVLGVGMSAAIGEPLALGIDVDEVRLHRAEGLEVRERGREIRR